MSRAKWDHAVGGAFATLGAVSVAVLLNAAGAPTELAIAIPGAAVGVIGWIWWGVARANRRPDRAPGLDSGEVEALRLRMEDLDLLQARVAELEERVEFSERLLARLGEAPDRLKAPR